MAEELLEKIPPEKRWLITAQAISRLIVLRGDKGLPPLLGKEEGIIAPVLGLEKWFEINTKIWGESGKRLIPWVNETFNIPVEDAVEATKLAIVAGILLMGPEFMPEIIEATPERVVAKITKCPWMERYKEFGLDLELISCKPPHQAFTGEGLKEINPKITTKLTKAMPRGDPYCEEVFEFKEE
jgi:hypothetical protein